MRRPPVSSDMIYSMENSNSESRPTRAAARIAASSTASPLGPVYKCNTVDHTYVPADYVAATASATAYSALPDTAWSGQRMKHNLCYKWFATTARH
eukprot:jgi/Chrzof1/4471/Cz14g14140.t1